jgi:hypothetical protein
VRAQSNGKQPVRATAIVTVLRIPFTWDASFIVAPPEGVQGLSGTASNDVWAACGYRCLFHYDGASWTRFSVTLGANVYRPFALAVNDVYFAGQSGYTTGEVLRFDGSGLSQLLYYGEELFGIWAYATGSGFACGEGRLLHFRPSQPLEDIPTGLQHGYQSPDRFQTGWGSSASDMYCVGNSGAYHYDGVSVSRVVPLLDLLHISGTSALDVWVVGRNGVLQHFDGAAWTAIDAGQGTLDLVVIAALSSQEVFAAGTDRLFEYDGSRWNQLTVPAGYRINASALYAPSGDSIFLGVTRLADNASFVLHGTR